jgi:hypothetical protein
MRRSALLVPKSMTLSVVDVMEGVIRSIITNAKTAMVNENVAIVSRDG